MKRVLCKRCGVKLPLIRHDTHLLHKALLCNKCDNQKITILRYKKREEVSEIDFQSSKEGETK